MSPSDYHENKLVFMTRKLLTTRVTSHLTSLVAWAHFIPDNATTLTVHKSTGSSETLLVSVVQITK